MLVRKCSVIARDRTVQVDESYTIQQAIEFVNSKGLEMSIRKTFLFYGLRYIEDRSFISRYRTDFNLSDSKTLYDIKLKELRLYKDTLIGHPVNGH